MKKIVMLAAFAFCIGTAAYAQDTTSTIGQKIKKGAQKAGKGVKKAGHKTAELASKGASTVVDKTDEGRVGPDGQKIYIDNKSKYYWIDKKGHKQYVTEAQLKPKS